MAFLRNLRRRTLACLRNNGYSTATSVNTTLGQSARQQFALEVISSTKKEIGDDTKLLLETFAQRRPRCAAYHQQMVNMPTPLVSMKTLAAKLNLDRILVKDEGKRMGLKAFKGLGVSFAVDELAREEVAGARKTLCTMTDGNHGTGSIC